jgi:hypothetical protein
MARRGGLPHVSTIASANEQRFGDLGITDFLAPDPKLVAIHVHDKRTGALIGKFRPACDELGACRGYALRGAHERARTTWSYERDGMGGPPGLSDLEAREEWS